VTTGIANTVGVRRTETCLVVWSGQAPSSDRSDRTFEAATPTSQPAAALFDADAYYDAGGKGCAEGPLDRIAALLRQLESGQTLEVRATDPSVAVDLPAWCRMTGHTVVDQQGDRYLIRRE
jgi:tRNA 2-thiouridine synthesizing protein A